MPITAHLILDYPAFSGTTQFAPTWAESGYVVGQIPLRVGGGLMCCAPPVSGGNDALAAILERGRAADEADALLAALVDGGVYVPVNGQGCVLFVGVDDTAGSSCDARLGALPGAVNTVA